MRKIFRIDAQHYLIARNENEAKAMIEDLGCFQGYTDTDILVKYTIVDTVNDVPCKDALKRKSVFGCNEDEMERTLEDFVKG